MPILIKAGSIQEIINVGNNKGRERGSPMISDQTTDVQMIIEAIEEVMRTIIAWQQARGTIGVIRGQSFWFQVVDAEVWACQIIIL